MSLIALSKGCEVRNVPHSSKDTCCCEVMNAPLFACKGKLGAQAPQEVSLNSLELTPDEITTAKKPTAPCVLKDIERKVEQVGWCVCMFREHASLGSTIYGTHGNHLEWQHPSVAPACRTLHPIAP